MKRFHLMELTLKHELRNNTMEDGALVMKWFALLSYATFSCAQGAEVLDSFRDGLAIKTERDSTSRFIVNFNVKEDGVRDFG